MDSLQLHPQEDFNTLTEYKPVLMHRDDLQKSLQIAAARPIVNAGKIYRYQNILYINEKYEGVHVYDNADPSNPVAVAFLEIPGNLDIAIQNGVIYADNATDLVGLQLSAQNLTILSRTANVFPETVPPDFGGIPDAYLPENRPDNTVIIKWEKK
ncbi:MAG: hypothetical protein U5L96_13865 [Owenweeksia sp.]|nr:hypothetical protein [Owenweeksia sp.]